MNFNDRIQTEFIPLPQPFNINRGTALKLIAALRSGEYRPAPEQLGFTYGGVSYRNFEGVLCEVVRSPKTIAWDGVSALFDGEQFYAPNSALRAAKVKGSLPDFASFERAADVLEYMLAARAEKEIAS